MQKVGRTLSHCISSILVCFLWCNVTATFAEPCGKLCDDLDELIHAGNDTVWPLGEPDPVEPGHVASLRKGPDSAAATASLSLKKRFRMRQLYVSLNEYLTRHQPQATELRAALNRRAAERLQLWPTPWQWTEAYHEVIGARAQPLYDDRAKLGARWPALARAVSGLEAEMLEGFTKEFVAARPDQAAPAQKQRDLGIEHEHPEGLHVTGDWKVMYVWTGKGCTDPNRFRRSCAALQDFQNALGRNLIQEARFATLHPGTKVMTHTADNNQRLKVHCGVHNPSQVELRIADRRFTWQPGKCVVLDDSFEHDIVSPDTAEPRTILEIKLEHPDLQASGFLIDPNTGEKVALRSEEEL